MRVLHDKDYRLFEKLVSLKEKEVLAAILLTEGMKAYEKIKNLDIDALRHKTVEFKEYINNYIAEDEARIKELKLKAENEDLELEKKNEIYEQVDKLEKQQLEKIEEALNNIMPEAFAVLKETAKRFKENEVVEAKPVLWIVIPCYNEQEVLPITAPLFLEQLNKMQTEGLIAQNSKILFVNDGSKDKTWDIITSLARDNAAFTGISQSRNRGHQNAVLAGLMEAKDKCDITISIDCDGQDDISAMENMVREYHQGAEVVYGVRSSRKTDTFFKRATAEGFYKFLNLMGAEVVFNHADYRLISSKVLKEFAEFKETSSPALRASRKAIRSSNEYIPTFCVSCSFSPQGNISPVKLIISSFSMIILNTCCLPEVRLMSDEAFSVCSFPLRLTVRNALPASIVCGATIAL